MACDATNPDETLVAGDDLIWSWTTDEDVSGWSDALIEFRTGSTSDSTLLATSQGESPTVITTGSEDGDDFDVPATNFATGVFSWFVRAAISAGWSGPVWMHVRAKVDGADDSVWPPQRLPITRQVAVRDEVSP